MNAPQAPAPSPTPAPTKPMTAAPTAAPTPPPTGAPAAAAKTTAPAAALRQAAGVAPATGGTPKQRSIVEYLDDKRVHAGIAAVAGKFLTADRMLRLCVNAVKRTPALLRCDPSTVLGAMMTSAALGLEPNTVQQQAFLIPYKRRAKVGNDWVTVEECQFQIGYRGFITLAYRSPRVRSLVAHTIHAGDTFEHEIGTKSFVRFVQTLEDRGPLLGSFCYVQLTEGGESLCLLPLDEVLKIRGRSETFRTLTAAVGSAQNEGDRKKAQAKLDETPWVLWEDDMAAKSAIKKHAKLLPIASNDALVAAAEVDNHADIGGGRIDLAAMTDPDQVRAFVGAGDPLPLVEREDDDGGAS